MKCSHLIRESFRFMHWQRFWASSKRHDAEELRRKNVDTKYPAKRLERARKMVPDGVAMAVLTGAFQSPGNFRPEVRHNAKFTDRCIACGEIGFHEHIFWNCPAVRAKFADKFGDCPQCTDPLQRRYGLPLGTQKSALHDVVVLEWMKLVALEVWNIRYNTRADIAAREAAQAKKKRERQRQQQEDDENFAEEEQRKWLVRAAAYEDDE